MPLARFRARLAAAAFALVAPLLAPLPAAAQMQPEDRAILRSEIRSYLLEHPEIIMEVLEVLEQRRRDAEATADRDLVARHMDRLEDDGFSFVAGNPDGDVTVVEFLDYNCGFCKRAHADVRELIETDPGLRYVVKEFPILGPTSRLAAQAALAATYQDDGRRYMAFNDLLMKHNGQLSERALFSIADDAGLNVRQLRRDMERPEIDERLAQTYQLARAMRIEGTPSFVIGGQLVRGYIPLPQLREAVAAERARGG
ncbi:MAG: DsbA family protein [Pseudomonadota bacterium]